MGLSFNKHKMKQLFLYLLPTLIIVLQNLSIASIRLSWLLSVILFLLVLYHFNNLCRNNVLLLMASIIIVFPIISQLWSISTTFNTSLYLSLVTGLFFCLYIYCISEYEMKYFLDGCFASCVIFTAWGIYEIFTGNYLLFNNEEFINVLNPYNLHYPGVAFANTNDLTQYIVMLIPIIFLYEWKNKKYNIRMLLCAMLVGAVFVIYHTSSHLGMISFAISLLIVINKLIKSYLNKVQRILVFFIILALIIQKADIFSLIYNNLIKFNSSDIIFTGRAKIYLDLLKSIIENPIGGFGNAYTVTSPHNLFLYILSDFGLINGILFAGLLITIIVRLIRKKRNIISYGILSMLLAFPLTSCISSGNEQRKIIWLVLGLGIRYAWQENSKD